MTNKNHSIHRGFIGGSSGFFDTELLVRSAVVTVRSIAIPVSAFTMTAHLIALTVATFTVTVRRPPYSSDICHDSSPDCPYNFHFCRDSF